MDVFRLPDQWRSAFARDLAEKPAQPDPVPERRLARLLAAYIVTGLFFTILPGTVLGVWNLVGISSQREMAAVPAGWVQAHGHAQFFGWFGTFIIGISLYAFPKFRGSVCRSIPIAWVMWAMWSVGVGLRWLAGVQPVVIRMEAKRTALESIVQKESAKPEEPAQEHPLVPTVEQQIEDQYPQKSPQSGDSGRVCGGKKDRKSLKKFGSSRDTQVRTPNREFRSNGFLRVVNQRGSFGFAS